MKLETFPEVPPQVWEDLEYEIARCGLDYADNYRAYRFRDGKYKKEFIERDRRGCCGTFEGYTVVDGDKWIIGCNHGH
jgi:hypothetical protein